MKIRALLRPVLSAHAEVPTTVHTNPQLHPGQQEALSWLPRATGVLRL